MWVLPRTAPSLVVLAVTDGEKMQAPAKPLQMPSEAAVAVAD